MSKRTNVRMQSGDGPRISVHGSRTLADERVKLILMEEINEQDASEIVTYAEPDGVCQVARKLAKEMAIPLKLHFLNFKYMRGAFEHRSKACLTDCDRCIFIHDGKSKGTQNEKTLAEKLRKPLSYYVLEPCETKHSIGFDIDEEWDWDKTDWNV